MVVTDPQTYTPTDRTDYNTLRRSFTSAQCNCYTSMPHRGHVTTTNHPLHLATAGASDSAQMLTMCTLQMFVLLLLLFNVSSNNTKRGTQLPDDVVPFFLRAFVIWLLVGNIVQCLPATEKFHKKKFTRLFHSRYWYKVIVVIISVSS